MRASQEGPDGVEPELTRSNTAVPKFGTTRTARLLSNASEKFAESRPAVGMFHAFGSVASNVPTPSDIKSGNFNAEGWSAPAQRRNSLARRESITETRPPVLRQQTLDSIIGPEKVPAPVVEKLGEQIDVLPAVAETPSATTPQLLMHPEIDPKMQTLPHDPTVPYPNGYMFPPKHTFAQTMSISLRAFSKWVITPFGFLLTLYALNIVAWGGMLFLILIRATPAMSHPSWNSWDSGAKTWLEIDSQILNALFCVTGLGLAPWRFRDLYFLLRWRIKKDKDGLRKLAGIHRDWFRLEGSEKLDPLFSPDKAANGIAGEHEAYAHETLPPGVSGAVLALPIALSPSAPLTGERASPSMYWKLDFVIWAFVWNTLLQIVLCGLMWGLNKYNRPSWSVGLFISLACIIASAGGWVVFKEGKRVKKIEGVPVGEDDRILLEKMRGRTATDIEKTAETA